MNRLTEITHLGIECRGTQTTALLLDPTFNILQRWQGGPANARLITNAQLLQHFHTIAQSFPTPATVGIGMAGVRGGTDINRISTIARKSWPQIPVWVGHDLESALAAAGEPREQNVAAQILILSGTGSCCFGRNSRNDTVKIGGWGHILGDKGSGYEIGLRALKAVVYYNDRDGKWPTLGTAILRFLALNEPDDLIDWAQHADKRNVAQLAKEVFSAATRRDRIARDILHGAASTLAHDALACARRLARVRQPVEFILNGGVLLGQPAFAAKIRRLIQAEWTGANVRPLRQEGAWGAARKAALLFPAQPGPQNVQSTTPPSPSPAIVNDHPPPLETILHPQKPGDSPTEQRNTRSSNLDRLSVNQAVELMLSEEEQIPAAIRKEQPRIARLINWVANAFSSGGRLFYVGAGTSGRLGVLDASECPPTFRSPPDLVQGIIAGGQSALWQAVEGAEDDMTAGAKAVESRNIGRHDVVVGIAASGRTPFVWGALWKAKQTGSRTALLCFNPSLKIHRNHRPDLIITPNIGPEILTGSTRLKAGTATKLILNMVTTIAMVRSGKVMSNLMVDLHPTNEKLRTRAVRIVDILTGAGEEESMRALKETNWLVKAAVSKLRRHPP